LTSSADWQVYINEMEVSKKDIALLTYHPVYEEDEKNRILNKLIQQRLRPYSLFQGEEVDKLIDFTNPKAIRDAVKTLTNITLYEDLKDDTAYIFKRAEESLAKKIQASTEDTANFDRITVAQQEKREALENEEEKNQMFQQSYEEN